jgi:hypothetical protein
VPVGEFRLDIQAESQDGRTVIIENQLERTDHGHLGQLLVYASGLEAASVVWVAPRFREDHRRTLDWLNERTDTGVDFFGVEVGVVRIADGPRAPVFEVVARPNNWQKDLKEGGGGSPGGLKVSPLNAQRQELFGDVLSDMVQARPAIHLPTPAKGNWLAYASGPWGYWAVSAATDNRFRVEAYIDTGVKEINKQLFDELAVDRESWDQQLGFSPEWERLDDKRASRIAVYTQGGDLSDPVVRGSVRSWAVNCAIAMYDAMNDTLRARARELRALAKAQQATIEPAGLEGT